MKASPAEPILVVDDDEAFLRLVERKLRRAGFSTVSATSGQAALKCLESCQPSLLLLDLKLRDMEGKELIQQLEHHHHRIPFVIISGQGDERVAVTMMKHGALDYLVKDVDFLQFVPEVVQRALAQVKREKKLAEAETALRRSEANLAKAQQIAHIGSYEMSIPPRDDDYRSDETYRILGLNPAERPPPGADLQSLVHPEDQARYRQVLQETLNRGAPFDFEYRVVRPDRSVRHVQSVGEAIRGAAGRVVKVVGTLVDITARKRVEMRQQVQHATTRVLAEAATLAEAASRVLRVITEGLGWEIGEFWSVDPETQLLKCLDLWLAPKFEASGWLTATRALTFARGIGLPGMVWASRESVWRPEILKEAQFTRGGPAKALGLRSTFVFPLLGGREVLGVVALFSRERHEPDEQLTQMCAALGSQIGQFAERQRAQEAFKREHAFISAVLGTSGGLVVVLDTLGRVVRFNRACELTTGYTFEEVRGRPFWEIFLIPEEMESVQEVFRKLRSGEFPNQHENYWLTKDGQCRLIAWSNTALLNPRGAVEYIISTGIDTTERKRLEKEILEISDREQRRIGQDLHDGLGQHLAATELMSQVLEQRLEEQASPEAGQAAEITRHVRDAISQTRLLARGLSPVTLESEGLMSALEELAADTERMFRVRCRFECREPVRVRDHAAATHLYRIAQEAVSNAIKHGKAQQISIELQPQADQAVLTVADTGVGFPSKVKKTGLGLRIMRYRAGIIGAALRIEPGKGEGTRVICSFRKNL